MAIEESIIKRDLEFKNSSNYSDEHSSVGGNSSVHNGFRKRNDKSKLVKPKSSIKEAWPEKYFNVEDNRDVFEKHLYKQTENSNLNCEFENKVASETNISEENSNFNDNFNENCFKVNDNIESSRTQNMSNVQQRPSVASQGSKRGVNRRGLDQYFRIEPCLYSQSVYLNAAGLMSKFRGSLLKSNVETPNDMTAVTPAQESIHEDKPEKLDVPEKQQDKLDISELDTAMNEEIPLSENVSPSNVVSECTDTPVEGQHAPVPESGNFLRPSGYGAAQHKVSKFKPVYRCGLEKRRVYELSFQTLKFENILEKILEEVAFFSIYPDLKEEEDIVLVILNDYIARKFQKRTDITDLDNEEIEKCTTIEEAIFTMKTKLYAAIARTRIRNAVRSLEALLPEEVRAMEMMAKDMPIYAWVNYLKMPLEKVNSELQGRGYKRVPNVGHVKLESMEYTTDRHCSDLFVFSRMDKQALADSDLMANKEFIIQDKSSCMAVHCMMGNIIPNEECAVINPTSIATAIHLESLMSIKFGGAENLPPIRIFRPHKDKDEPPNHLQSFGSKACKMVYDDIIMIDPTHEKFKTIKHAFVQARCTRSGVVNPIDFLVSEGDDIVILKDYCLRTQTPGKPVKMAELTVKNVMLIRQAIHFSKARTITYVTSSVYEEENENLVTKALDVGNKSIMKDAEKNKTDPFWIIPPPIPVSGTEVEDETLLKGKFVHVEPNPESNGYFISVLLRDSLANQRLNNPELMADHHMELAGADHGGGHDAKGKQPKGKGKKKKGKEDA